MLPPDAVNVTEPPLQKVVEPDGVMTIVGVGFTVTLVGADAAVQPAANVPVTVKVPVAETVMVAVVAPVLHR